VPKNAARKKSVRQRQRATGERYNVARRHDENPGLPFDPSWVHPEVSRCPVCRGENVEWVLRGSKAFGPPPQPGDPTEFIRPTDPGFCFECHSLGQGGSPDDWRLANDLEPDRCPRCGKPPIEERHLPWNDGKHRRTASFEDLVPADGRWYRYDCSAGHWWISSPCLVTLEGSRLEGD
jgi:predicted Zn-ribbon and HTH transcriptional regulator